MYLFSRTKYKELQMAKIRRCANGTLMTGEIKAETMKYHFSPNQLKHYKDCGLPSLSKAI